MSQTANTTHADAAVTVTEDGRVLNDPTHAYAPGHGNTPGAWAMCGLVVVGFVAGAIALFLDIPVLLWISIGVVVLGALVGIVAGRGGDDHAHH